jgi:two-component system OmpR family sensor kinase
MRPWRALSDLNDRTSLRGKLITALLALVAVGLVAISVSSVMLLRSYLVSQDDAQLRGFFNAVSNSSLSVQVGRANPGGSGMIYGIQQPGTPLTPVHGYGGYQIPAPSVPTSLIWADANNGKLLTVPAESGSDTWRIIASPVTFTNSGGTQQQGTLVVGVDLGNIKTVIGRLALAELIIGFIIVCILGMAAVAVVRANLRPLVEIEETAGEIADGHLNRRVPERDPETEIGRLGRSLNIMLSQIESAFHDREQSEEAARESAERMRRFIADASHELRTPLTAIRGFAEYYRQRGGLVPHWDRDEPAAGPGAAATATGLTPDELDRIMRRVEKEAARMGLLVEDLLLLARLDQQRPLAHQPVDLLSLAADAVGDARLLAPSRTIDLSVQPGAAFLVIGDEARLRQVIGNLMSNALTHTPDGTPIEVSISSGVIDPRATDPTPAVILDVTDHGPGMSQKQAQRVFERFYRADQARTRTTGGSGLGLAIVAALVAAQDGLASVRTTEGQGATFRISLPLAPEAQDSEHPDDDEAGPEDEPELDAQQAGPEDEPELDAQQAGPEDEPELDAQQAGPEDEPELDAQQAGQSHLT